MITIPFEILSMKNSKEIRYKKGMKTKGKLRYMSKIPFVGSRNIVIKQKELITLFMAKNRDKWLKEIEGKSPPYILCYKMYRQTLRRFDYNNITQLVFDCMTKAKWIEDDDMKNLLPIACGWDHNKENPRMEFYIANEEQEKVLENNIFSLHNKNESYKVKL